MRVKFKDGQQRDFNYKEGDRVTIVLAYITARTEADRLQYTGTITEVDEAGIWCLLDGDSNNEEYISFADMETVRGGI